MDTVLLRTSDWSAADLQRWLEQRELAVHAETLAQDGPTSVAFQRGLWPRALIPVRSVRIGNSRLFRAYATEHRQLHAYFIEVHREGDTWLVSLRRDPSWIMTMVGWGAGGTLVLSWPFAAIMTATGTPPTWLEPWWRMALLKLALGGLALLPSLLILRWLRDGRKSRAAYKALLRDLESVRAGAP
jgi:hypothetical protein